MTNIKCFFLRLYLLTYSPVFPLFLGWILFMTFRIYFEPVMLCDDHGWTLFQWKNDITNYIGNYRIAIVKIDQYNDLNGQLQAYKYSDPQFNSTSGEEYLANKIQSWQAEKIRNLAKIRELEFAIKAFEPGFQAPINTCNYYPRVGRGY